MNARVIYQYWFVTAIALGAGLVVWPSALVIAMLVVALHTAHFLWYRPRLDALPLQVRLGFLGLLVVGQIPYLGWVHWVQGVGVAALLIFDYCLLARLLSLMPWNRSRPLTWSLAKTVLFSRPSRGGLAQVVSPHSA